MSGRLPRTVDLDEAPVSCDRPGPVPGATLKRTSPCSFRTLSGVVARTVDHAQHESGPSIASTMRSGSIAPAPKSSSTLSARSRGLIQNARADAGAPIRRSRGGPLHLLVLGR